MVQTKIYALMAFALLAMAALSGGVSATIWDASMNVTNGPYPQGPGNVTVYANATITIVLNNATQITVDPGEGNVIQYEVNVSLANATKGINLTQLSFSLPSKTVVINGNNSYNMSLYNTSGMIATYNCTDAGVTNAGGYKIVNCSITNQSSWNMAAGTYANYSFRFYVLGWNKTSETQTTTSTTKVSKWTVGNGASDLVIKNASMDFAPSYYAISRQGAPTVSMSASTYDSFIYNNTDILMFSNIQSSEVATVTYTASTDPSNAQTPTTGTLGTPATIAANNNTMLIAGALIAIIVVVGAGVYFIKR